MGEWVQMSVGVVCRVTFEINFVRREFIAILSFCVNFQLNSSHLRLQRKTIDTCHTCNFH